MATIISLPGAQKKKENNIITAGNVNLGNNAGLGTLQLSPTLQNSSGNTQNNNASNIITSTNSNKAPISIPLPNDSTSNKNTSTNIATIKDTTPKNENTSSTTTSYSDSSESNTKSDAENFAANYGDFNYANKVIIDDVLKQYLNREKFSYDFNEDALYQQYKDKYIQQGKMAMQDTMGQAAALTGGYGNSYAASVGNQAYNASLENLNDIIPELYQLAYDRYNQEGQDLINKYSLLADDMATEYGMWSDKYNRLYTDYRNQIGDSQWQAQFDEGVRQYDEQFAYQKDRDAVSDKQWEDAFNYQKDRDAVSDSRWEQEFNYGKEQDATKNNQWQKEYDSSTFDNGDYDTDAVRKAQNFIGADPDGMWGSQSAAAAKAKGYNSLEEVMEALGISPGGGSDIPAFTGTTYQEAYSYLTKNGVPSGAASGIMDQATWQRKKNIHNANGGGSTEVTNYNSYKEYLADITEYLIEAYA